MPTQIILSILVTPLKYVYLHKHIQYINEGGLLMKEWVMATMLICQTVA